MARLQYTHNWKPGDLAVSISHHEVSETCPTCGGSVTKEIEKRVHYVIISLSENGKGSHVFSKENGLTYIGLWSLIPAISHDEPMPEYPGGLRQYAEDYQSMKARALTHTDPVAVRLVSYLLEDQDRKMPDRQ